jgi:hypothetical protein
MPRRSGSLQATLFAISIRRQDGPNCSDPSDFCVELGINPEGTEGQFDRHEGKPIKFVPNGSEPSSAHFC